MITTMLPLVIYFLLGLAVGSFLNVCIDRLPLGQSIIRNASHCDACLHPLAPLNLVPVLSYMWLRGRCRYCGASISPRIPIVELITGVLYGFFFWHFGLSVELGRGILKGCVNSQAVYPLSEQDGLKAQERRYTAYGKEKH